MSQELIKWLNQPLQLPPITSVVGEEGFFVREIKQAFLKTVFQDSTVKDFNFNEFEAQPAGATELSDLIETLPTLSDKRLIFCNSSQNFKDEDWEEISFFIDNPSSTTVIVFFFSDQDGRKKHIKKLKKQAHTLEAKTLKEWEREPWVDFIAQRQKVEFTPDTKKLFLQLSGGQLLEVEQEIKKLKTFLGSKNLASEKDILSVLSEARMDNIFKLTEAIGSKDLPQSLLALTQLLKNSQNAFGILALIGRHIRLLSRIKEGQKKGLSRIQLQNRAGVSSYFIKNYLQQSELWTEDQIIRTMQALQETDKALKSSPVSAHIWLENFILQACGQLDGVDMLG